MLCRHRRGLTNLPFTSSRAAWTSRMFPGGGGSRDRTAVRIASTVSNCSLPYPAQTDILLHHRDREVTAVFASDASRWASPIRGLSGAAQCHIRGGCDIGLATADVSNHVHSIRVSDLWLLCYDGGIEREVYMAVHLGGASHPENCEPKVTSQIAHADYLVASGQVNPCGLRAFCGRFGRARLGMSDGKWLKR